MWTGASSRRAAGKVGKEEDAAEDARESEMEADEWVQGSGGLIK